MAPGRYRRLSVREATSITGHPKMKLSKKNGGAVNGMRNAGMLIGNSVDGWVALALGVHLRKHYDLIDGSSACGS